MYNTSFVPYHVAKNGVCLCALGHLAERSEGEKRGKPPATGGPWSAHDSWLLKETLSAEAVLMWEFWDTGT